MRKVLWALIAFISILFVFEAKASDQSRYFLRTLKARGFPYALSFWYDGLSSVSSISFNDESINSYRLFFNSLDIDDSMQSSSGRLKPFHQLSSIDMGTLAHESFHAYVANYIKKDSRLSYMEDWMRIRSENLFREEGISGAKAFTALEEAYAGFISNVITSARGIESYISRYVERSEEPIDCPKLEQMIERRWDVDWNHDVFGYYYRDGFTDYYSDRMKSIWSKVTGGEAPDLAAEYFVKTSIQKVDRDWIADELFKNNFSSSPWRSFEEILTAIGC